MSYFVISDGKKNIIKKKNRESSQGQRWQLDVISLNKCGTAKVPKVKVIKYKNKHKPLENRFEFI